MIVVNRDPSQKQLKQFSLIGLTFFLIVGILAWYADRSMLAYTACFLAAVLGWGVVSRNWARVTFSTAIFVTYPIGFVLSYLVLSVIYFLVITPTGLLSRVFGRDPLTMKGPPVTRPTFWQPIDYEAEARSYYNQY